MSTVVNIAAYRFVTLDRLDDRRETLRSRCVELGLMGTILLSEEGINLFLAGPRTAIDPFLDELREDEAFTGIEVKESFSQAQPFDRMKVKIKRQIIPFGIDGIQPSKRTSPKLPPQALKAWLDEGRGFTLLDVRNDFEIEYGTFADARPIGIPHFRLFPEAAAQLPEDMKQQPVVMFCTGGIRCEKAGPYLEQQGFAEVYQLDGGILKYFEECGGEHYRDECFVFDDRVALDSKLGPKRKGPASADTGPLPDKRLRGGTGDQSPDHLSRASMAASMGDDSAG